MNARVLSVQRQKFVGVIWEDSPVTTTAFLDETKRNGYWLSAVIVPNVECHRVRKVLRAAKGSRATIHMRDLRRPGEQRRMVQLLAGLDLRAVVLRTTGGNERAQRDRLLHEAARYLYGQGVERMVIESCGQDKPDRDALFKTLRRVPGLTYEHQAKMDELLLCLADIHVYGYSHGSNLKDPLRLMTTDLGKFKPVDPEFKVPRQGRGRLPTNARRPRL